MASRLNLLNRPEGPKPQSLEPTPKRQKMSSVTSESTLAAETSNVTPIEQGFCSVASEDLSSMMFQVADLQRFANSWALHNPLTGTEFEMKASFKACEETANSLRDTIESLEVNAASLASAQDLEAAISNSHDPSKDNNVDNDKTSSEYEAKAADTLKFLIRTGVGKIISDEFASLAKFEGAFQISTYARWYPHRMDFREDVLKVIDQDPEPLADFKEKVKRHFQRDMMERVVGDFKRDLEGQWKKYGEFVADS